jgi:hypothetical protein
MVSVQRAETESAVDLGELRRDAGGHVPIANEEAGAVPWALALGTLDWPGASRYKCRVQARTVALLLW